jgi:hypothetical protein
MHAADPYGHLLVNGSAPSDAELTRLVRATSVKELRRVRQELLHHGVLSVTADGVLYSRRMVRDEQNAAKKREDGKKGGNPQLRQPHLRAVQRPFDDGGDVNGDANQTITCEVNHDVNRRVKPHIPDAIFQNPLPPSGAVEDEHIDEIAGTFLERYPEVYARCRSGATYRVSRIKQGRDLDYARELARGWPDVERLVAMLEVFLRRTDIAEKSTPGTPGQFLNMAPDCDRLLKEHGR